MNGGKRLSSVVSGGVRAGAMGTATALALLLSLSGGVLSMPAPAFARAVAADEKLPTDPALVTGTLENGLSYVVRKHANPAGRVSVWIHVSSGSLNEVEETRGMAHYLEHMAFNGSANFPPGKVVDFFQSLGLQFGRDQNAFTSFDQTTYQLALPDAKPETIEKAMLFFSDVAGRLLLNEKEIESERGIIIEERRTRLSAQQRVQDYILERVAPESTFGRRLPIGTEATIMG
ncbi:MAG: M16 family metallopeptidase, partial [Planctomyces sp.]